MSFFVRGEQQKLMIPSQCGCGLIYTSAKSTPEVGVQGWIMTRETNIPPLIERDYLLTNRDTTLFLGTARGCHYIPIGEEPYGFTRVVCQVFLLCIV